MVNCYLSWNPIRLVQRIGRLYRYGQKKKVVVFNIRLPDTMDQQLASLSSRYLIPENLQWASAGSIV